MSRIRIGGRWLTGHGVSYKTGSPVPYVNTTDDAAKAWLIASTSEAQRQAAQVGGIVEPESLPLFENGGGR